jgi:hypothetical protein
MVNGIKHTDFDAERELVRIVAPIGQLLIQTIY